MLPSANGCWGAVMDSLEADASGTWRCRLTRPDGHPALIVWNLDQEVDFPLDGKEFRWARDLYGKTVNLAGRGTLKVDAFPRLLE